MPLQIQSNPGPDRESAILGYISDGRFQVEYSTIKSSHGEHEAEFQVFSDALKVEGIRVNVSAETQQKIADMLGCLLLTPKLANLMWLQREVTLHPFPRPITATTEAMVEHSTKIDAALTKLGNPTGLIQTTGKHWVVDNEIPAGKSMNYGWHFEGSNFQGIGGEVCATLSRDGHGQYIRLIQGRGTAHDMHHVDYCLSPEVRVLTANLQWVPISSLVIGDELVGFDESLRDQCKLRRATVQSTTRLMAECYEIVTSRATIIASAPHRWPVRGSEKVRYSGEIKNRPWSTVRRRTGWVPTSELKPGDMIPYLCQPWEQNTSWDGAWMAGFLDGEGWLSGTMFGFGQNPGVLLDRAIAILRRNGMNCTTYPNKKGCMKVHVTGPRGSLRALGTYRPIRLMAKSSSAWEGRRVYGGRSTAEECSAEVLNIIPIGPHPVVGVGTSTKTLIAEGLLSHNSQNCTLVARGCVVDGQSRDLLEILRDPELAPLASHQGVLRILRQPGVPEPENVVIVMPEVNV